MKAFFLSLVILATIPSAGFGLELYTIIHNGCTTQTGLIVNVDDETVLQLDISGRLVATPRKGIEHVLVYNTIDNPYSEIDLTGELQKYLREVKVSAEEDERFIGWPIRFFENFIVFFDLVGKTHLVDKDNIEWFDSPSEISAEKKVISDFKDFKFGFGSNLPSCSGKAAQSEDIQPTRMLSDQIKIHKFLTTYREGFIKLKRFQRRTVFYARSYLFDKQTKIALVINRDDFQEEFSAGMPIYFQWPTGSVFGPQGLLVAGSKPNENLPSVEPVFGLRFDGKYHFLSASFAGNPFAFSTGASFMIENRFFMGGFFEQKSPSDTLVLPQYNQVVLTGLERGAWSISIGYYYPLFGIQANGLFREILSGNGSPILKAKYTTADQSISIVGSQVSLGSNNPNNDHINLIYAEEMSLESTITAQSRLLIEQLESFQFDSTFIRVNFDMDVGNELKLGLSEVVLQGNYQETIFSSRYALGFNNYITSINLHQGFGDNVALNAHVNLFIRNYDSQSATRDEKTEENKFSFTLAVEFIL